MHKVILYIAMSLDGFIARVNGDVDWLKGDGTDENADIKYDEFFSNIDTVIMGRVTYEQILTFGDYPYKGTKGYVYSRSKTGSDDNVEFTSQDPSVLLSEIKNQIGKDIWLVGGSGVAKEFVNQGLVDEYHICITPIILGAGIPLFTPEIIEQKLKLVSSESINGFLLLQYVNR